MSLQFSAEPAPVPGTNDPGAEKTAEESHLAAVKAAESAGPIAMLDLALALGEDELRALKAGEVEMASCCCELRARLLSSAAKVRIEGSKAALVARLRAMGYLQARLSNAGQELRTQMAEKLNKSKAESRRLRGYRQSIGQALTASL